jgi:hypothetical protein
MDADEKKSDDVEEGRLFNETKHPGTGHAQLGDTSIPERSKGSNPTIVTTVRNIIL